MKIKPLNNYVLVEIDEESEKTENGLIVPGVKGEKTEAYAVRAIVVELGKNAKMVAGHNPPINFNDLTKIEFKVGDKVLVMKWEGQNVSSNGKNYILIKPEHVMALLA